jgi:hypothetical protein
MARERTRVEHTSMVDDMLMLSRAIGTLTEMSVESPVELMARKV